MARRDPGPRNEETGTAKRQGPHQTEDQLRQARSHERTCHEACQRRHRLTGTSTLVSLSRSRVRVKTANHELLWM